jgi:hypothetical protein
MNYTRAFQNVCVGHFTQSREANTYMTVGRTGWNCKGKFKPCPGDQSEENRICVLNPETDCPITNIKFVSNLTDGLLLDTNQAINFTRTSDHLPLISINSSENCLENK